MDIKNCWDCPAEAVALALFMLVLLSATWVAVWLRDRSRAISAVALLVLCVGAAIWLLQIIYVPSWGIRLYDTPRDTAVIYGDRARLALVAGVVALLANFATARWALSRRRA